MCVFFDIRNYVFIFVAWLNQLRMIIRMVMGADTAKIL